MSGVDERYAPGWAEDAVGMMARRTALERAAFFLPLLDPGMRVLDVGCGPGSITIGLASVVGPAGEAIGIDFERSQVDRARVAAERSGVTNIRFEVASVYALPFTDESFDAVFGHALLEHLARPELALAELRRVLRRCGVLGVADSDWSRACIEPRNVDVEEALAGHFELRKAAGGDPFLGARLPQLVAVAGFDDVVVTEGDEPDMPYSALARYIGSRIDAASREASVMDQRLLRRAASAARRWAQHEHGRFDQHWTFVTGTRQ